MVQIDFAGGSDVGRAVAVQSDDKIIVVGRAASSTTPPTPETDSFVLRLTSGGTLDSTFGTGGKATFPAGGSSVPDWGTSVKIQSDGKIIVASNIETNPMVSYQSAVARFSSAGVLDPGFGTGGTVLFTEISETEPATRLALQPDGRILLAETRRISWHDSAIVKRLTASGVRDNTFGTGGEARVSYSAGDSSSHCGAIAVQDNGKIVIAGDITTPIPSTEHALARLTGFGTLDRDFGNDGVITGSTGEELSALAIQADGKIVAGGSVFISSGMDSGIDFALLRFLGDAPGAAPEIMVGDGSSVAGAEIGSGQAAAVDFGATALDATVTRVFTIGNGGTATLTISSVAAPPGYTVTGAPASIPAYGSASFQIRLEAASLGPVSGTMTITCNDPDEASFTFPVTASVTLNGPSPGTLDGSFGISGKMLSGGAADESARALAMMADGSFVIAGSHDEMMETHVLVERYQPHGVLDPSFGNGGRALIWLDANPVLDIRGVAVQPDGKVLVAGRASTTSRGQGALLLRLNANGTLDAGFGTGGFTIHGAGINDKTGAGIAVTSTGKIVVGGSTDSVTGMQFMLLRFTSGGVLDPTFAGGGEVQTAFLGASQQAANALLLLPGDEIILGGYAQFASLKDLALARYTSGGALDPTFGTGGRVTADAGSSIDSIQSLAHTGAGEIVASGEGGGGPPPMGLGFLAARFTSAGALDTSFNTTGTQTVVFPSGIGFGGARAVAVQGNGKIVLAGSATVGANNEFALARLTTAGLLDTSFGVGGKIVTSIGSGTDEARALGLQGHGRIVVAGDSWNGFENERDFAVARFHGDIIIPGPEIVVLEGGDVPISTGGSTSFGPVGLAQTRIKTFTVRNVGSQTLASLALSKTGGESGDFALGALGSASLAPGASTTFTVSFTPPALGLRGTSVHIASNDASENPFVIQVSGQSVSPPVNDGFASRASLGSSPSVNVTGSNIGGSLEAGEVNPGNMGGASVWHEWTAPASGWVTVHTVTSTTANQLDTVVAIFTGSTLGGLTMLGYNDESRAQEDFLDYPESFGPSRLSFFAASGTSYKIAVHGYASPGEDPATGSFELHIAPATAPPAQVLAVSLTRATVDVNSAAQSTSVSLTIETTTPLFPSGFLSCSPSSPSATYPGAPVNLTDMDRTSGTATLGVYQKSITIHRYSPPGQWPLPVTIGLPGPMPGSAVTFFNWSPQGNDLLEDSYLIPSPAGKHLAVQNTGAVDAEPPALAGFSTDSTDFNVTMGSEIAHITIQVTDALSGFQSGSLSLVKSDFSQASAQSFQAPPFTGDENDGTYNFMLTVPASFTTGQYFWELSLLDKAGNTLLASGRAPEGDDYDPLLGAAAVTVTNNNLPEINVSLDMYASLTDGSTTPVSFGSAGVGVPVVKTFTIYNSGTLALSGISISKDGPHAADFTIGSPGMSSVPPGMSTTFNVTFNPSATGMRTAAIHIASNDGDESPFDINLAGTGTHFFSTTGSTSGRARWRRPDAHGNSPPISLSITGLDVPYHVLGFTVGVTGAHTMKCQANTPLWDTYLFLYSGSFDPDAQLSSVIVGNDESGPPGMGLSGFTANLQSGTTYFLVSTGSYNLSAGPFTLTIEGPGAVSVLPPAIHTWRQTHFGTTSGTGNSADDADPEKDGIPNLLEFATNGNPNLSSPMPGIVSMDSGGSFLRFDYTRSKAALIGGTKFIVEWSDDLASGTWTAEGVGETVLSSTSATQQVRASAPSFMPPSPGRRFMRLRVE